MLTRRTWWAKDGCKHPQDTSTIQYEACDYSKLSPGYFAPGLWSTEVEQQPRPQHNTHIALERIFQVISDVWKSVFPVWIFDSTFSVLGAVTVADTRRLWVSNHVCTLPTVIRAWTKILKNVTVPRVSGIEFPAPAYIHVCSVGVHALLGIPFPYTYKPLVVDCLTHVHQLSITAKGDASYTDYHIRLCWVVSFFSSKE